MSKTPATVEDDSKRTNEMLVQIVARSQHYTERSTEGGVRSVASLVLAPREEEGIVCEWELAGHANVVFSSRRVPRDSLREFASILAEVQVATAEPQGVVWGSPEGSYFIGWCIVGVVDGKSFDVRLHFIEPGASWSELGVRFRETLRRLTDHLSW